MRENRRGIFSVRTEMSQTISNSASRPLFIGKGQPARPVSTGKVMLRIVKFSAWISWLVNDSASSILPEPNTLLSIGYLGPRWQLHKKVNDIGCRTEEADEWIRRMNKNEKREKSEARTGSWMLKLEDLVMVYLRAMKKPNRFVTDRQLKTTALGRLNKE